MEIDNSTVYNHDLEKFVKTSFNEDVFDYDEINLLLPDYFHDIKTSNLFSLYFSSDKEKKKLLEKEALNSVPLSFFKESVISDLKDFVNHREAYLRQKKLNDEQSKELCQLYFSNPYILNDPLYYRNLVKIGIIERSKNKAELINIYNKIFHNRQTVTLSEMKTAYEVIIELIKNNFAYSHQEIIVLLSPVLKNIPVTFLTLLQFFFIEEIDSSKISEIWNKKSEGNMNLLELRESIIEKLNNKSFYVDLQGLPKDIPFYCSIDNEDKDFIKEFLNSIKSTTLPDVSIDFLVSLSEWLYKYDWQDYEPIVKNILQKNNVNKNFFHTEFYSFYIKRILEEI